MGDKRFNLVLGFSGPYGAGSSSLVNELKLVLEDWQGLSVRTIKVSQLLLEYAKKKFPDEISTLEQLKRDERREKLQEIGTKIRQTDKEMVGKLIIQQIVDEGIKIENDTNEHNDKNKIIVFLVDSIKNSNECKLLKRIYGDEFHLAFVHLNRETRWNRLVSHNHWDKDKRKAFDSCDEKDRDEKEVNPQVADSGQQVRKVAQYADYFIVNNNNLETLKNDGIRLVRLLLGEKTVLPPHQESSMHVAFSAASRSFCLSRQVGAALVGPNGEVIAVGHNDVPRAGGGLYRKEDGDQDQRCYINGERSCTNDLQKNELFQELGDEIIKIIDERKIELPDGLKDDLRKCISKSEFKRATEYCRAVHAEMTCILSRVGSTTKNLKDCTLYVTTQPCHNCTKHILCAGIGKVVYIEPYPKSLALNLHGEAVLFDPESEDLGPSKLRILPYAGVSPRKYSDFFNRIGEIKNGGHLIRQTRHELVNNPSYATRIESRKRVLLEGEMPNPTTQTELEIAASLGVEFEQVDNRE